MIFVECKKFQIIEEEVQYDDKNKYKHIKGRQKINVTFKD